MTIYFRLNFNNVQNRTFPYLNHSDMTTLEKHESFNQSQSSGSTRVQTKLNNDFQMMNHFLQLPFRRLGLLILFIALSTISSIAQNNNFNELGTYYMRNSWKDRTLSIKSDKIIGVKDYGDNSKVKLLVNDKKEFKISNFQGTHYLGARLNASGNPILISHTNKSNAPINKWIMVKIKSSLRLYHPLTKTYLSCGDDKQPKLVTEIDRVASWSIFEAGKSKSSNYSEPMLIEYKIPSNQESMYLSTGEGGGLGSSYVSSSGSQWRFERYGDTYFIRSNFGNRNEYLARITDPSKGDQLILTTDKNGSNTHWMFFNNRLVAADKEIYLSLCDNTIPCLTKEGVEINLITPNVYKTEWFMNNYVTEIEKIETPAPVNNKPKVVVDGRNVKVVKYSGGQFINPTGKTWKECSNSNGTFNFTEQGRDQWSVYLFDSSRNMHIQLDLWQKTIYIGRGDKKRKLYSIISSHEKLTQSTCN